MDVHLILRESGSVGQDHILQFGRVVSCSQSQAPQGVPSSAILTDDRQDFVFDALAEGNFVVADSDVGASVNDSLWGPL